MISVNLRSPNTQIILGRYSYVTPGPWLNGVELLYQTLPWLDCSSDHHWFKIWCPILVLKLKLTLNTPFSIFLILLIFITCPNFYVQKLLLRLTLAECLNISLLFSTYHPIFQLDFGIVWSDIQIFQGVIPNSQVSQIHIFFWFRINRFLSYLFSPSSRK